MRQAGRYLPEYRALRARTDFLTLCRTPELAMEASLQPVRRFPLDAAIVFSDILLPAAAMGCQLTFDPGPRIAAPIRTRADVQALRTPPMADASPTTAQAVELLVRELAGRIPVIGFAGAPFTLAAYLVQGVGGAGFGAIKDLMHDDAETLDLLLDKLTTVTVDWLQLQIAAGAGAVQLFDSWAGLLSSEDFHRFALPSARRVVEALRGGGTPVIYFAVDGNHLIESARETGADVLGVCWRTPLDEARRRTCDAVALQGNLDPRVLLGPPELVRAGARQVLHEGRGPGHIMNLGHGILPDTPIASVEALVETVAA
jgi:uroporphyrinogen decarboxylase